MRYNKTPDRYPIDAKVAVKLLNGEIEIGTIEDGSGGEYSIRTSQWREKKWYKHDEILHGIRKWRITFQTGFIVECWRVLKPTRYATSWSAEGYGTYTIEEMNS